MTFQVRHQPNTVTVVDMVGGVIPVVATVDAWLVHDDESPIATVLARSGFEAAETYADRIAELLERHGLADVPDRVPPEAS